MNNKTKELEVLKDLVNQATKLEKQSKYLEACDCLQKASGICQKWGLWEKWVEINSDIGWMYQKLAKYEHAIQHLERIRKVAEEKLEADASVFTSLFNVLGVSYRLTGQYAKAILFGKKALCISKKYVKEQPLIIGSTLNSLGYVYSQLGAYEKALTYYNEALHLYENHLGKSHINVASALNNIGVYYKNKEDNAQAIRHYEEAIKIRKNILGDNHPKVAQSLYNLGICYRDKGDYERGRAYFHRAMHIWEEHLGKEHPHIASVLNELAICNRQENKITQAIQLHEKALEIRINQYGDKHLKVAESLNNIANCYQSSGNFEQAINHHQQALEIRKDCMDVNHPLVAVSLTNLGNCYQETGKGKLALNYHQQALDMRRNRLGSEHSYLAVSLMQMGICHRDMENYAAAYEAFQQSLVLLSPDFTSNAIDQNPTIDGYKDGVMLLKALRNKSETLWKQYRLQSPDLALLQNGLATMSVAIDLIKDMKRSYKGDGSKLILAEKSFEVYNQAIDMAIELSKQLIVKQEGAIAPQSLAFYFTEQCKAILLLSKLKEQEAKAIANIPTELTDRERQLKIELNYLDKCIAHQTTILQSKQEATGEFTHSLLQKSHAQHFQYKQEYDALIEQFEKDYPAYFQLKYHSEKVAISDIQTYLQKEHTPTVVISYFVGTEKIYIFAVSSQKFEVQEIPKPLSFTDWVIELQDAIQLMDIEDFVEISRQLYDCLIAPIESFIGGKEKLIILRHDVLEYLPFEILLRQNLPATSNLAFVDLPYLLQDFEICYHYSATLLLKGIDKAGFTKNQADTFLGFAPINFNETGHSMLALESKQGKQKILRSNRAGEQRLAQLPNTETEVKEVFQLFQSQKMNAKAFLFGSASKENLLAESPKHKYILISTHGFVEEEKVGLSGIYLAGNRDEELVKNTPKYPNNSLSKHLNSRTNKNLTTQTHGDLLYTSDAYHLQLNADLVVLSSCSSGIGKLQKGEGMMALNRGFLSAGASNIVFTQFDIPDKSSSLLVRALFRCILEGESYAAALRLAKLEVMQQEGSSVQDWAGFVLIGV